MSECVIVTSLSVVTSQPFRSQARLRNTPQKCSPVDCYWGIDGFLSGYFVWFRWGVLWGCFLVGAETQSGVLSPTGLCQPGCTQELQHSEVYWFWSLIQVS